MSIDGTTMISHASPYKRHLSSCPYRTEYHRHYSDPDAGCGWNSNNKTWYFGHILCMLCCHNGRLKTELPILMKFTDARHHDSKRFLFVLDDFGQHCHGLTPKSICLDSAHDNILTYKPQERRNINALIDINGKAKSFENVSAVITLDKTVHSFSPAGHKMC